MASMMEYPYEETTDSRLEKVNHLVFEFETIDKADCKSGDSANRNFNDMGINLIRENNPVSTVSEMVNHINSYSYSASLPGRIKGGCCIAITGSLYYWCRRRIIPEGYLGHYVSSGRHMVTPPGLTALFSTTDWWSGNGKIPVDGSSEKHGKIILGSKAIIYVGENQLGGAFKIVDEKEEEEQETKDGQYVLFPNGRYVVDASTYRQIDIITLKLDNEENRIRRLGPLSIVHIKEGYIGGAYRVETGKYQILPPGPPYILHEKDWESITISQRSHNQSGMRLGPLTFLTVRAGYLAGAYHKQTGEFHILPPGNTYKLDTKDYTFDAANNVKIRSPRFRLGAYYFVTVKEGWVSGAYKKHGGQWKNFPAGATYQLSVNDYEAPQLEELKHASVTCGPMTYLTVQEDKLAGAWRVEDGKFVEFDDHDRQYELHKMKYHTLQIIDKYSVKVQKFGPNIVVTIPDGNYGVFEKEGQLEVVQPGWYKMSYQYIARDTIPSSVNTFLLENYRFRTKDGIPFSVNCTMIWKVDPKKVMDTVLISNKNGFQNLQTQVEELFKVTLGKYCKKHTRQALLPTKQEMVIRAGPDVTQEQITEILAQEKQRTYDLYMQIENNVQDDMQQAMDDSNWGIMLVADADRDDVPGINLEGFSLPVHDAQSARIIKNLSDITISLLQASEARIQGGLEVEKAEIQKTIKIKQIDTKSFVNVQNANAASEVLKINATVRADVQKIQAKAKADASIAKLEAANAVNVLKATTQAEANAEVEKIKLEIRCKEILEKAETRQKAVNLLSEANYNREVKQNEAAEKMGKKQFELEKANLAVKAMEHFGKANWRMPSDVLQFYESFSPYLRMGPITANELLGEMKIDPNNV